MKHISRIKKLYAGAKALPPSRKAYADFFAAACVAALNIAEAASRRDDDKYFAKTSPKALAAENRLLYGPLLPARYAGSYSNPARCAELFGPAAGPLFSYIYSALIDETGPALRGKTARLEKLLKLLIDVFEYGCSNKKIGAAALRKMIAVFEKSSRTEAIQDFFAEKYSPEFDLYKKSAKMCLKDARYVYSYGEYVGPGELKAAAFVSGLDRRILRRQAAAIADAYRDGFIVENKARGARNVARIAFNIGLEPLVCLLTDELEKRGFVPHVSAALTTPPNRQYDYDHRFDDAVYLDDEYAAIRKNAYLSAFKKNARALSRYSGVIFLRNFGEATFSPEISAGCLKLSDKQQRIKKISDAFVNEMLCSVHTPDTETSFTSVAFPSPAIGKKYAAVFMDTVRINSLDSLEYEKIQQGLIDILDGADHVAVKGKAPNRTDLVIKMPALKNPRRETNFFNCGAHVNVPAGEVFTTPELRGTRGTLHVGRTYLDGLEYADLEIKFRDGYITQYSCENFREKRKNEDYIRENLLFPNKTLPMGEFAIGTNTLAYNVARKHGIMKILPVLILEKMGPHFAIGDTCYCFVEDLPVYNRFNKKEIVARENDRTRLRKTSREKAYTRVHTDITLPYESIEFISAVAPGGKQTDIIRNGRFVPDCAKPLNKYLNGLI